MANRPSLDDYVDVAERIQDFKDAHPEGSLQTLGWEVVTVEGVNKKTSKPEARTFIVYRAAAYRTPEDTAPGHGIAWEPWPGGTPYTLDSELMNAETAAWGRAIVALGLVANRSLASRQEVRNRVEDQAAAETSSGAVRTKKGAAAATAPEPAKPGKADDAAAPLSSGVLKKLRNQFEGVGKTDDWLRLTLVGECGVLNVDDLKAAMESLSLDQAVKLMEAMGGKADGLV